MSTVHHEFADILLRQSAVSPRQLDEARRFSNQTASRLDDTLVRLGYVSQERILEAWAEALGLVVVDLTEVAIPPAVLELVPESVARENTILPLWVSNGTLFVAISDPSNPDVIQKLEFILNKEVRPVLAAREQIIDLINRCYGESETESVDSMLAEFTDTAIDFTETEAVTWSGGGRQRDVAPCSIDLAPRAEEQFAGQPARNPLVERRATVRYYHRMNPQRMLPLLVILSPRAVQEVVQRGVAQEQSETFQVAEGSLVEIEPVLPGCACYPPKEQVRVGPGEVSVTFWIVPHVLGQVMQARVAVRQDGRTLAEVPLQVRVVQQSVALLLGALGVVLPFVLLLKHFRLDFESQLQEGFSLYAQLAQWLLQSLTPEVLGGMLLSGTAALYLWLRPRKRDVFWDIGAVDTGENGQSVPGSAGSFDPDASLQQACAAFEKGDSTGGELLLGVLLEARPDYAPAVRELAERRDRAGDHPAALKLYERVLRLGAGRAGDYFRASLAAYKAGYLSRALGILQQAEKALPPAEMSGPLWYNRGCFAARLGVFPEAMRCLNRAVDVGYDDLDKYRCDPDLEVLRWHAGFKRLLQGLGCAR
jgi:tetratricopeptide (TPR) repeat protein